MNGARAVAFDFAGHPAFVVRDMNLGRFEIPGRVRIAECPAGWPLLLVSTGFSEAEIHPHGAHVTRFRRTDGEPVLFLSERAVFEEGKAIRGGVPVIFPWFGGREGLPAHGTARTTRWELEETAELDTGSVLVALRLPETPGCEVTFRATIGRTLEMDLCVANTGDEPLTFENCLHTYLAVGDIHRTEVRGLRGARFIDSVTGSRHVDEDDAVRFRDETDRIYQNTAAACEIRDPVMRRVISVRKGGSRSTVVWNPWAGKSERMSDFGNDEYLRMVCVESGNVKDDAVTLAAGAGSVLSVEIDARPLA